MIRAALFDAERKRRFLLARDWRTPGNSKTLAFVGLNPSVADENRDDPTVRKMIGFATRWGFGRIVVMNLVPIITTKPWRLPLWSGFDHENLAHLETETLAADAVCVAWGSLPRAIRINIALAEHRARFLEFLERHHKELLCIGITKDGSPLHPSRCPYTSAPEVF